MCERGLLRSRWKAPLGGLKGNPFLESPLGTTWKELLMDVDGPALVAACRAVTYIMLICFKSSGFDGEAVEQPSRS